MYPPNDPRWSKYVDEVTRETARAHRRRAALASSYAARGWHVLPTRERRPIIKEWETAATADPYEAEAYWYPRGDWAGANIGIACGPSGLVVLDIDCKKGKNGFASLEQLGIELPDTLTVRTPSGGLHVYFLAPDFEVRLSASQIGDGLDIRAWGGQVIAPGSVADGRPYEIENDAEVAPLPVKLHAILWQLSRDGGKRKLAESIPEIIPEGEREERLVSLAGSMRRRGASVDAIRAALEVENSARCVPPLDEEALDRISGSVGRYEPAEASGSQAEDLDAPIEIDLDLLNRTLTNLETTRQATDIMRARAMRRQRAILGGMTTPVSVREFVAAGPDPTEVCIWGVPEPGGVMGWAENQGIIIAGPPGTGKSTIALQVILRRVGILGGDVLGMPVKVCKSPLTYLALDRADQIRQSVARMIPDDADEEAIDRLLMIDNLPPMVDLRQPETFIAWLNETGSECVVMDSAKDLGFDLNDSSEGQAFNFLVQATLRAKIQVFILHHSRKVPRGDKKPLTLNDLHGSQWIAAGAGSVLMLDGVAGPDPKRLFHVKPLTVPMAPLAIGLDVESGEVQYDTDIDFEDDGAGGHRKVAKRGDLQNEILQLLAVEPDPKTNQRIADDLGVNSGSVSRATKILAQDHLIARDGRGWVLNREELVS
jgi:hypothetical protein